MNRRQFLVAAAALSTSAVAGCFEFEEDRGIEGDTVSISNVGFRPTRLSVDIGTTVTWENESNEQHTVTSIHEYEGTEDWEMDATVDAGETVTHTFEREGVYEYICETHGYNEMCGVVLVGDAGITGTLPCEAP